MFVLFRARNQTVECYIDHYYGRPAIASASPRGTASLAYRVRCAHRGATAQIRPTTTRFLLPTSPRRVRLAGPTAQQLLRSARNPHPQSRT